MDSLLYKIEENSLSTMGPIVIGLQFDTSCLAASLVDFGIRVVLFLFRDSGILLSTRKPVYILANLTPDGSHFTKLTLLTLSGPAANPFLASCRTLRTSAGEMGIASLRLPLKVPLRGIDLVGVDNRLGDQRAPKQPPRVPSVSETLLGPGEPPPGTEHVPSFLITVPVDPHVSAASDLVRDFPFGSTMVATIAKPK
ncbi:unnamed protein product [Merluccius merluccius]